MFPSAWGFNSCRRADPYSTPSLVLRAALVLALAG